jgi:hypothetical protein
MEPTSEEAAVLRTVSELYRTGRQRRLAIRLLGVQLSNLVGPDDSEQLPLPFRRPRAVGSAIDQVRIKYGYDSVHLGDAHRRERGHDSTDD